MSDHDQALQWPDGKAVAVALTFDTDAEVGWNGYVDEDAYARRLALLSEGRFGPTRGIPRILRLLRKHKLQATFFVPGLTAKRHPDTVKAIVADGHEVAHHGHRHVRADGLTPEQQREEIERGLEALSSAGAPRPRGYRGPSAELTPETLALLNEHGFLYDSTCMGDDRPYVERFEDNEILELPISHSLVDFNRYTFSADFGGNMQAGAGLEADWLTEYEVLRAEGGASMIPVMHPEIIGRAYRMAHFERVLERILSDGGAWFTTMSGLAEHAGDRVRAVAADPA